MNNNLLRVLRNLASMGIMRIVSAVLSFVLVVYIARSWGALALGEFSLALTYFFLLQQMPLLGLHIVLMRDIAASPETASHHMLNASALAFTVSLILALIVGAGGQWFYQSSSGELHIALWLVGAAMVPTGFICAAESVLIGQQRMHVLASLNVMENIVRTLLSLLAVYLGYGMTTVFTLFLLGRILTAIGYFRWGGLRQDLHFKFFDAAIIKTYLKQVPTFFGIMLFAAGINRLDFILLSKLGSVRDVGLYSAPYKVYEVATMVPTLLMVVLFPSFAASYKTSKEHFAAMFKLSFRFILLLGTPCVLLSVFYAQEIMLLFGPEYHDAYPALEWLLLSLIAAALIQLFSIILLATGNQNLDFKTLGIACVGYAIMLVCTIPHWGFLGAAVSTFGVAILQTAVRYYFAVKYLQLHAGAAVITQTVIASLIMGMVLYLLRTHPVLAGVAALCAYIAMLFLLKAITPEQFSHFKAFLRERNERKGVTP